MSTALSEFLAQPKSDINPANIGPAKKAVSSLQKVEDAIAAGDTFTAIISAVQASEALGCPDVDPELDPEPRTICESLVKIISTLSLELK